jgi:hypothetical protein
MCSYETLLNLTALEGFTPHITIPLIMQFKKPQNKFLHSKEAAV